MEIILSPIKFLYLLAYTVCYDMTKSWAYALPLLSVMTVTIIYFCHHRAAKLENDEKLIRSILEPQIAEIKDKYRGGADRQAAIERLYHRYAYSPLYAVREAAGVLLQLPFLFGAYAMISTFPHLSGVSFGPISDLSQSDGLLDGFNLLPFVMTGANIATVFLATPAGSRERKQGVISALVFLALLYGAPSALLVYWTGNNILYLVQELWKRQKTNVGPTKFQAVITKIWNKCADNFSWEKFALAFTAGLYAPVQLYLANAKEFWFSLYDILPLCFECALVAYLLLSLLDRMMRGRRRDYYLVSLAALALMFYLQGSYLNPDYGELDGRAVDWAAYRGVAVTNTAIWLFGLLAPLVLAWKKPALAQQFRKAAAISLVFIQLVTLAVLTENWQPPKARDAWFFSNEGLYTLGKNENIIIFILDNYGAPVFDEFIKTHPAYKEGLLKNFTYYPDTVCGSAPTLAAMPHILTNQPYNADETFENYVSRAFHEAKLYPVLKKQGFDTKIYTTWRAAPTDFADYITNLRNGYNKVGSYRVLAQKLYRFTECAYFPHILKKRVWMYTGDFEKAAATRTGNICYHFDDSKFYKGLLNEHLSLTAEKAFRLYHLDGVHPPYDLSRDALSKKVMTGSQNKKEALIEQEEGLMTILGEYFAQMKRLGIYDKATILLMADHGDQDINYGNPLFMIKRGMETSDFSLDETAISYKRLHPTLLGFLGADDVGGMTIYDKTPETARTYHYLTGDTMVTEIAIEGKLPYSATVKDTGCVFRCAEKKHQIKQEPEQALR